MRLPTMLVPLLLVSVACERSSTPLPASAGPAARDRAPARDAVPQPLALPEQIPTDTLDPTPICVRAADLPPPRPAEDANRPPEVVRNPDAMRLGVPKGFVVQVFADELDEPRWLALTPEGDVLVTETRRDRITRLVDADGDGAAERREVFATAENGLDIPFGMAFAEVDERSFFFLGNHDEVRRYAYEGRRPLKGLGERIAALPGGGYRQHWTRNVVVAPSGDRLFVSIGSASNDDPEALPRASIQTMGLDGSGMRTFAHGLRNPVGLAFHPRSKALYATVNERDHLGDDLVPDFLARIERGAFYGWPYAYIDGTHLDPNHVRGAESVRPDLARSTRSPEVLFQAHSAPLGLAFYEGGGFPARYRGGAFVAFRGSWNRGQGTGYKVVFVPFDRSGDPTGCYEDFVTGFLLDPSVPRTWGRPVGLLVRDGSLLFTDEAGGRLFRVSARR